MEVKLEISQGPVNMNWLEGKGLSNEFYIWDEIYGMELFPIGAFSANYVLSVKKDVKHHSEVGSVESELLDTLTRLSEVWIFSGGSLLPLRRRKTATELMYSSNARYVENELLTKDGKKKASSSLTTSLEYGCTYSEAPLEKAISICCASKLKPEIRQITKYYTDARLNDEKWFLDLYKVREAIKTVFGSETDTIEALAIDKNEWRHFGNLLNNNDLRHSPKGKIVAPAVDRDEKNKLELLAWRWVNAYLKYEGLV